MNEFLIILKRAFTRRVKGGWISEVIFSTSIFIKTKLLFTNLYNTIWQMLIAFIHEAGSSMNITFCDLTTFNYSTTGKLWLKDFTLLVKFAMSHLCLRIFCMGVICESSFAIDFLLICTGFYFFTTQFYCSTVCPREWKLSWENHSIWFSLFFFQLNLSLL